MNLNFLQDLIAKPLIINLNGPVLRATDQQLRASQSFEINHSLQPAPTLHNPN